MSLCLGCSFSVVCLLRVGSKVPGVSSGGRNGRDGTGWDGAGRDQGLKIIPGREKGSKSDTGRDGIEPDRPANISPEFFLFP